MKRIAQMIVVAAFGLGSGSLTSCAGDDGAGGGGETSAGAAPEQVADTASEPITIELREENNSGQTGTATIEATEDTFDITLEVTPPKKFEGEYQRAYVHDLTCDEYRELGNGEAQPETVVDELNDLANGESSSTVYVPLAERAPGYSINVHEQNDPFAVVACGDIPAQ